MMDAVVDINQVTKGLTITLKVHGANVFKWKLRILRWVIVRLAHIMRFSGEIEVV